MQNENVGFWAKSNNKVPLKVPKLKAFFLLPMVLKCVVTVFFIVALN